MVRFTLTHADALACAHGLRVAADQYRKDARNARFQAIPQTAVDRLARQFLAQAGDAERLAEHFELEAVG